MGLTFLMIALGIAVGAALRHRDSLKSPVRFFTNATIYILLLSLGVALGNNQEVLSKFDSIGLAGVWIAVASILGSIAVTKAFYRFANER